MTEKEIEKMLNGRWTWEIDTAERAAMESYLAGYDGKDKIISSADAMMEILRDEKKDLILKTDMSTHDKATEGFRGGDLIVVSGKTKHGKTTFCQSLTHSFIKSEVNSLWFSYELRKKEFIKRFPDLVYFYLPDVIASKSLLWLDRRILEARLKADIKVVFIDHLHFLVDMEKIRNPSLEIGTIVRNLKTLAINHDIVIFLISHIMKIPDGVEPGPEHIRDSAFTTCEADSTYMIFRLKDPGTNEYGNRACLKICNHRHTGVMDYKIPMIFQKGIFYEEETRHEDHDGDRGREQEKGRSTPF